MNSDRLRELFEDLEAGRAARTKRDEERARRAQRRLHGWWRGWGCHIGPLYFCWVDSWAQLKGAPWWRCYGLDVTWGDGENRRPRRLLNIGSRAWRHDEDP